MNIEKRINNFNEYLKTDAYEESFKKRALIFKLKPGFFPKYFAGLEVFDKVAAVY